MRGIMHDPDLDGLSAKDLTVPDLDKLMTLEGKRLDVFINELPTVNLTPGKANDVVTNELEKMAEEMEKFRQEAIKDKGRLRDLEKQLKDARNTDGPLEIVLQLQDLKNTGPLEAVLGTVGKALDAVADPTTLAATALGGLIGSAGPNGLNGPITGATRIHSLKRATTSSVPSSQSLAKRKF